MHTKRCEAAGSWRVGDELYSSRTVHDVTLTTELLFYLVLSPAGWIGTSYYILSGFYVCAMYTSLQSLPEKLYQFVDLEKKKKEKSVIVCKFFFFLFFVGTCLACSVSICDGLMFYCSLLMPVCYCQHSMKTSPAIGW